ncbi:MAG: response regulator [Leptolyngbyaceae bacterium]|nr:response regulator [Leptolyngbyaceae bacterium]
MQVSAEILVVDDVPTNLEVLTEILSASGYRVAAVTSGERAIKRLYSYIPDLILLDIQMPGIDGFKTCQEIKQNPHTAHIPIIFITAFSDIGNIVRGFSLGAVDYITKPFQELELLTRVRNHLKIQKVQQQLEREVTERTHELKMAMNELRASQLQLIQQEKMSALGNLVAGVAHELNNPVGFVSGNVRELRRELADLMVHLEMYERQASAEEIAHHADYIELDYLRQDIPKILDSMQVGCDRIQSMSISLRTFSRSDQETKVYASLHDGLESTLLILQHRIKATGDRPTIKVVKDYDNELPEVQCFPGQLNQVFMNILANAIDMFDEMTRQFSYHELEEKSPTITIQTRAFSEKNVVEISICDNGNGMSKEVKARIFDHLFTTKSAGKGTGLGMAIAHQIVTETHHGTITVESELGKGSEFVIELPIVAL